MKKHLLIVLVALILSLTIVCFVACNNDSTPATQEEESSSGEYETVTYTVTYDSNGGTTNNSWLKKTYVLGDKILEPTYIPIKKGYCFSYWSTGKSGTAFDFDNSSVEMDLTLYAVYDAEEVTHNFNLKAALVINGDNYSIEETYSYASTPATSSTLKTTYGSTTSTLFIPTNDGAPTVYDGLKDRFVFWYYMKDGKPVRFSTIADSTTGSVTPLEAYNSSEPLMLYPMWLSILPAITVEFVDTEDDSTIATKTTYYNDTIDVTESIITSIPANMSFKNWTYLDSDDNSKVFVLNDSTDKTIDATELNEIVDYDYFHTASVKLYANWIKRITISDTTSYKAKYDLLRKESPTEAEQKEIAELLEANIEFTNIDFAGCEAFEPLFDSSHIFTGIIEGKHENTGKAILSGGNYTAEDFISVFGYVQGTIKNIVIQDATYVVPSNTNTSVHIGGLVTSLRSKSSSEKGIVFNCKVTMNLNIDTTKDVYIGGIAYENKGEIQNCEAVFPSIAINANTIKFGGIATVIDLSSSSLENEVTLTNGNFTAQKTLTIGGISAENRGTISSCETIVDIDAVSAQTTYIGGIASENIASVLKSKSTMTLGSDSSKVVVNGSTYPGRVGGILASNSGKVENCYSNVELYIISNNSNANLMVGGLVADNTSISTSSNVGAITTSYAIGVIDVEAPSDKNVRTNVGGIVGANSQNGISSVFAEVNIKVNNTSGTNNVGYLIGYNTSSTSFSRTLVSDDVDLYKNNTKYGIADTDYITTLPNEMTITHAHLCDSDYVFGENTSNLKFSKDAWKIVTEESTLPSLLWE